MSPIGRNIGKANLTPKVRKNNLSINTRIANNINIQVARSIKNTDQARAASVLSTHSDLQSQKAMIKRK